MNTIDYQLAFFRYRVLLISEAHSLETIVSYNQHSSVPFNVESNRLGICLKKKKYLLFFFKDHIYYFFPQF